MGLFQKLKPSGFSDPVKNVRSSEIEVDNWILSEFILKRIVPVIGIRPYPLSELQLMIAGVVYNKPDYIFEWGTNLGKSARVFYETCKEFKLQTKIISIDLPDDVSHVEHPGNQRGKFVKGLPEVTLIQGDGLKVSIDMCKNTPGIKRPLFFLDGDHSYDTVDNELSSILAAVDNPTILVHDTFYQDEISKYNIGPFLAIKKHLEQIQKANYKVISTQLGLPGMTLIIKPH